MTGFDFTQKRGKWSGFHTRKLVHRNAISGPSRLDDDRGMTSHTFHKLWQMSPGTPSLTSLFNGLKYQQISSSIYSQCFELDPIKAIQIRCRNNDCITDATSLCVCPPVLINWYQNTCTAFVNKRYQAKRQCCRNHIE